LGKKKVEFMLKITYIYYEDYKNDRYIWREADMPLHLRSDKKASSISIFSQLAQMI